MKTATLPPLRVEPELRQAAEAVLAEGESLSSFMEKSLRDEVNRRRMRAEFIARGLAARDEAKRTGVYYTVDEVMDSLRHIRDEAKAKKRP
ncbi:MAG TPA: YlcI/YnfO family protein [Rhodanobacteraceae bacterium]|nr:YlcI/YnfO family protein [Rhodanobacteraceae bacterium]